MVVALVALFISLGGVSYGVATGFIDSREIKNRTIRDKDVRGNSLTGRAIRESRLGKVPRATRADSATSADSATNAQLAAVAGRAENVQVLEGVKVAPSAANADPNVAQGAAQQVPLGANGALSIYAKCWAENDLAVNPAVSGGIFVSTSQPGSIMTSDSADLEGNGGLADMLNPTTAEDQRAVSQTTSYAMTGVANRTGPDEWGFSAVAPDGRTLHGELSLATKTGELAGGNGLWGPGPACVFTGFVVRG